ncbi:MAG: hypothetical protein AMJ56_13265 [Anaerolineae bacterium SG8_19]|jgi:hypothetical protein|nr:MAG: hypothetical protein AMJ56_13265 [Anaerolineae bacterium SG8_19]
MKFFNRLALILFGFAALWAIGGSIYLLATPTTIHEIKFESGDNGSEFVEEITRQASWYEVQGLWGVIVLFVFALLFFSVALFAFKRRYISLAITSFLAVILTFLAGLSIGPIYLLAVFAVLAGWLVLGITWIFRSRQQTPG